MNDFQDYVAQHLFLLERSAAVLSKSLAEAESLLVQTLDSGKAVFTCGNGGSAADAAHIAGELLGGLNSHERQALRAFALASDGPTLTAIANDFGFDKVFSRQLAGLGRAGDVLWLLSTSGRSRNLIEAVQASRELGIASLAFCPPTSILAAECDLVVPLHGQSAQSVQDIHRLAYHWLCERVEAATIRSSPNSDNRGGS